MRASSCPGRTVCRSAERFDARRYVRTRKPRSKNPFELTSRRATRQSEQFLRIVVVKVPFEQKEPRQMNRAAAELVEHPRKPHRQARDARPLQRSVRAVSDALTTICIKRRTSLFEVEMPALDLHEV